MKNELQHLTQLSWPDGLKKPIIVHALQVNSRREVYPMGVRYRVAAAWGFACSQPALVPDRPTFGQQCRRAQEMQTTASFELIGGSWDGAAQHGRVPSGQEALSVLKLHLSSVRDVRGIPWLAVGDHGGCKFQLRSAGLMARMTGGRRRFGLFCVTAFSRLPDSRKAIYNEDYLLSLWRPAS